MIDFSLTVWVLLAAVGAAAVLSLLWTAATHVRNQCHLHDLKVEVAELRIRYHQQLRGREARAARAAPAPSPPAEPAPIPTPTNAPADAEARTAAEPSSAATSQAA